MHSQGPCPSARRIGRRLISGTLPWCRCSREAGNLIGFADRSLAEARFAPPTAGFIPCVLGSQFACSRCPGQLYLDDGESRGRNVPLDDVADLPIADVLTSVAVSLSGEVAKLPSVGLVPSMSTKHGANPTQSEVGNSPTQWVIPLFNCRFDHAPTPRARRHHDSQSPTSSTSVPEGTTLMPFQNAT